MKIRVALTFIVAALAAITGSGIVTDSDTAQAIIAALIAGFAAVGITPPRTPDKP